MRLASSRVGSGPRCQYLGRTRTVMKDKYHLTDKFTLIASLLCPESTDEDVGIFKRVKGDRDKLAHGQDVYEASLPVQAVQEFVRRYLRPGGSGRRAPLPVRLYRATLARERLLSIRCLRSLPQSDG
jgi:hypothetical protein